MLFAHGRWRARPQVGNQAVTFSPNDAGSQRRSIEAGGAEQNGQFGGNSGVLRKICFEEEDCAAAADAAMLPLPLLSLVLIAEGCVALLLVSGIKPFVKTASLIVDITKTTKGKTVTRTLAAILIIHLSFTVANLVKTKKNLAEHHVYRTELSIMHNVELEAAFSGFILVLLIMIQRAHFLLRDAKGLRLSLDVLKKQSKNAQSEYLRLQQEQKGDRETPNELQELKSLVEEMRDKVENLQIEVHTKEKEAKAAEANVLAIRKQTEGIRLEYERLLEENENLKSQLAYLDRSQDRLEVKKNT
ncbi:hypothetical protein R1flu_006495 [Riccia fluitans]|uniref:Endoplasmic reticulum transmembrane protein n=1 Tax=Riccia fluitans TaxID=41844 RepID=A0ABD1YWU1_9MARC